MIDSIAIDEAILKSHNPPERPKKTQYPIANAINESKWTKQKDTFDALQVMKFHTIYLDEAQPIKNCVWKLRADSIWLVSLLG